MARVFEIAESVVIAAPPETVFDLVADIGRMGEWSPENRGGELLDTTSVRQLTPGTQFVGRNARRWMRWTTRCTVLAVEPGRVFTFRVDAIGRSRPVLPIRIATWSYRFDTDGEGTVVTETWSDDRARWPDRLARVFDRAATGTTFADFQRENIATTLRNLKRVAENLPSRGRGTPPR